MLNRKQAVVAFVSGLELLIRKREIPEESKPTLTHLLETVLPEKAESVLVKYIGRRERHTDALYGTGAWVADQVRRVSTGISIKMLKHPDVYVLAEDSEEADGLEDSEEADGLEDSDARFENNKTVIFNQLQGIETAEEIRIFAKEKLMGWEPDQRLKDPMKLRDSVMNQVGIVGIGGIP